MGQRGGCKRKMAALQTLLSLMALLMCAAAAPVSELDVTQSENGNVVSSVEVGSDEDSGSNDVSSSVDLPDKRVLDAAVKQTHPDVLPAGYHKTGGHIFDLLRRQVHKDDEPSPAEPLKQQWLSKLNSIDDKTLNVIKGSYQLSANSNKAQSVLQNSDLEKKTGHSIFTALRGVMLSRGAEDNTGGTWQMPRVAAKIRSAPISDEAPLAVDKTQIQENIKAAQSLIAKGAEAQAARSSDPAEVVKSILPAQLGNIQQQSAAAFFGNAHKGHHFKKRHVM